MAATENVSSACNKTAMPISSDVASHPQSANVDRLFILLFDEAVFLSLGQSAYNFEGHQHVFSEVPSMADLIGSDTGLCTYKVTQWLTLLLTRRSLKSYIQDAECEIRSKPTATASIPRASCQLLSRLDCDSSYVIFRHSKIEQVSKVTEMI
jgi:hypothetical protein